MRPELRCACWMSGRGHWDQVGGAPQNPFQGPSPTLNRKLLAGARRPKLERLTFPPFSDPETGAPCRAGSAPTNPSRYGVETWILLGENA